MGSTSRLFVCVVSLAGALAFTGLRAQAQMPAAAAPAAAAPAAPAPFQIRQTAYLKASNPHASDHFGDGGNLPGHSGNSIAISQDGNYLAIAAHQEASASKGVNGNQNDTSMYGAGAVYVFVRRPTGWAQQAYIKPSNTQQGSNFGMNVAFNADATTLAVSAYFESSSSKGVNSVQDDKIPQAGAVYVFSRTGETWSQQAYLKASNTGRPPDPRDPSDLGDGDQFGFAIALSGDGNVLAVGAVSEDSKASGTNTPGFEDDDSAGDAGAVYIFTRNGTAWTQRDYLKSLNNDAGDRFGFVLALSGSGNTLAVTSYDEDGSGRSANSIPDNRRGGSGALYILDRANDAWRQTAYLKGSQLNGNDASGVSVGLSEDGNTVIIGSADDSCLVPGVNAPCRGATWPPHLGAGSSGGVYVWQRTGNNWVEQAYLKASSPDLEDLFGVRASISGDGNTIAVGAANEDGPGRGLNGNQRSNAAEDAGAVYIFTRADGVWTQRVYLKGSNTDAYDMFGSAAAVSRDGKTIVIGAPIEGSSARGVNGNQADNSAQGAGAVYVFTVN